MPNNTDLTVSQDIVFDSQAQKSKLSFTSPTFKRPSGVELTGADDKIHDIVDVVDKDILIVKKGLSSTNFLEFYKNLMSSIESCNGELAKNIKNEIITPLNDAYDTIGENNQDLLAMIKQIQDNAVTLD